MCKLVRWMLLCSWPHGNSIRLHGAAVKQHGMQYMYKNKYSYTCPDFNARQFIMKGGKWAGWADLKGICYMP